ncbi:NADP adrenodoxin-like ferredoxin reductase [Conidiobolus coronatus NRRL 28638]|uniref:NADPH:adrenodoxin oxidoreductase, mitochondrial n=1 Tax=Conidiobolus coronatus (strain ATCC 28846 / CBS 209.66 / NRRL 28638) TaxID=796925 RepID=A0A137PHA5_CONC2|nr:NADP adrenodoxin-like ferredoxin reductase [Conidiobolus coronatus NRRL 28638]|eukprot:KXN74368.1 NADP adrenodoxin-like ferredoxin reductase [Conidiobolus coronatus NRRL 28638]
MINKLNILRSAPFKKSLNISNYYYSTAAASTAQKAAHFAVVGSGPGAFYTILKCLKQNPDLKFDIFEKLPTPYGLVRYGVAPDHPEVKICQNKFNELLQLGNLRYFGNIEVGKSLKVDELRERYSGVILAYGSSFDKKLGIEGETLDGVFSAREFVGWYNGLPEFQHIQPNLDSGDTATIFGQGNVALDVARVLLAPMDHLKSTDICDHALEALSKSKINKVKVIGRRGPLQVAFTIKELRELINLPNLNNVLDHAFLNEQLSLNQELVKKERSLGRLTKLMTQVAQNNNEQNPNTISYEFLKSPLKFLESKENQTKLGGVEVGLNTLEIDASGYTKAKLTSEREVIPCSHSFVSIGYKSLPICDTIPFDTAKGLIPNKGGKVIDAQGNPVNGVYTAGWLKTGPVGVIVNTMMNGNDTGISILNDLESGELKEATEPITYKELINRGQQPINYKQWRTLEDYEAKIGESKGKPREKVVNLDDMVKYAMN